MSGMMSGVYVDADGFTVCPLHMWKGRGPCTPCARDAAARKLVVVGPALVDPSFQKGETVIELHSEGDVGLTQIRILDKSLHIRRQIRDPDRPGEFWWGEWLDRGADRLSPTDFTLACNS
jgi:hypothetical protein